LNLKSFAQVELNYCHHRDGLRPLSAVSAQAGASIADANPEGFRGRRGCISYGCRANTNDSTLSGLLLFPDATQGSSSLATLG